MLTALWNTLLALAPWLLLGMGLAGLVHVVLPRGFVQHQFRGVSGVLKAVALGVPLPLCSCGVIPAGLGLKRDGASNGATVGFLISTPQTGIDSVLVSASFLGWPFALFKVLSAALTGLAGGLLVEAFDHPASDPVVSAGPVGAEGSAGVREMLRHALQILRSIWRFIVLGVVVSAAIETLVPADFFTGLAGRGALLPALAVLAISIPLYVCATASVPIAAALVASGMPPGAALVFLMAGPATNLATIGAVYRGLGTRAVALYLGTIAGGSILCGLTFDFVLGSGAVVPPHDHEAHGPWAIGSALVLLALVAWFALEDASRFLARLRAFGRRAEPALEIPLGGLSCSSCVSTLERALREERGVTSVVVTLDPARAVVRGAIDAERLRRVIERVGYTVTAPPG